jgi:hypothetical protein
MKDFNKDKKKKKKDLLRHQWNNRKHIIGKNKNNGDLKDFGLSSQ